jgi:hypothetical protein
VTVRLDSRRIVDDGMAAVAAGEETARCWWVALQMQAGATQLRRTLPPPENQVKKKVPASDLRVCARASASNE